MQAHSGVDKRLFGNAIRWMAGNMPRWRDLPKVFGKRSAVHAKFRSWSHAGIGERLFRLVTAIVQGDDGKLYLALVVQFDLFDEHSSLSSGLMPALLFPVDLEPKPGRACTKAYG